MILWAFHTARTIVGIRLQTIIKHREGPLRKSWLNFWNVANFMTKNFNLSLQLILLYFCWRLLWVNYIIAYEEYIFNFQCCIVRHLLACWKIMRFLAHIAKPKHIAEKLWYMLNNILAMQQATCNWLANNLQ